MIKYPFLFIVFISIFTVATEAALCNDINDGTVVLPAYLAKNGEQDVNHNKSANIASDFSGVTSTFTPPSCNDVGYGGTLPFPTVVVPIGSMFVIGGKADWLPNDPGTAGKSSIPGVDSNGNCVRDDIELYIARQFPARDQQSIRRYLHNYAKWLGFFLQENISQSNAVAISNNMYVARECAYNLLGSSIKTKKAVNSVFSKFLNTYPRSYRYIDNNSLLGGITLRQDIVANCSN